MNLMIAALFILTLSIPPHGFRHFAQVQFLGLFGESDTTVSAFDVPPKPLKQAPVHYPPAARMDGVDGDVVLMVSIDASGTVTDATVKESVREDVDEAAIASVRQWMFKPATLKGTAVTSVVAIPFRFKLDNGEKTKAAEAKKPDKGSGKMPKLLKSMVPTYPENARLQKIEGTVHVEMRVDENGDVAAVKLLKGAHPLLDAAALECVRDWKFEKPVLQSGKRVVSVVAPIAFKLSEK